MADMTYPIKKVGTSTAIGDYANGDYSEIREDGTQRLVGDATSWKDMVCDLVGRSLANTRDKVEYDWDEMAIVFNPSGSITQSKDRVGGNLEINHEFKVGTGIVFKPHIHWFQEVSSGTVKAHVLTMKYKLQNNNQGKTTAWTTVTCEVGAGGDDIWDFTGEADGFYNQISRFPDMTLDCNVSDTIQFQFARTDSVAGDMLVYFFDIHGQVDSFGSDDEIAKAE